MKYTNISLRPIMGEPELAISWLAERNIIPHKNEWGRYTLKELDRQDHLGPGTKLLIVDNLDISTDADLEEIRETIKTHPRWSEQDFG